MKYVLVAIVLSALISGSAVYYCTERQANMLSSLSAEQTQGRGTGSGRGGHGGGRGGHDQAGGNRGGHGGGRGGHNQAGGSRGGHGGHGGGRGGHSGQGGGRSGHSHGGGVPPIAGLSFSRLERAMANLSRELDLNETQQKAIRNHAKKYQEQFRTISIFNKRKLVKLRNLDINDPNYAERVANLIRQGEVGQADIMRLITSTRESIYTELNEEQKSKLYKFEKSKRQSGGSHGGGGHSQRGHG